MGSGIWGSLHSPPPRFWIHLGAGLRGGIARHLNPGCAGKRRSSTGRSFTAPSAPADTEGVTDLASCRDVKRTEHAEVALGCVPPSCGGALTPAPRQSHTYRRTPRRSRLVRRSGRKFRLCRCRVCSKVDRVLLAWLLLWPQTCLRGAGVLQGTGPTGPAWYLAGVSSALTAPAAGGACPAGRSRFTAAPRAGSLQCLPPSLGYRAVCSAARIADGRYPRRSGVFPP